MGDTLETASAAPAEVTATTIALPEAAEGSQANTTLITDSLPTEATSDSPKSSLANDTSSVQEVKEEASSVEPTCLPSSTSATTDDNKAVDEVVTVVKPIVDDDQTANAALSDQDQKFKAKLLESEAEQRNTSTSNAGESEYESANEEDLAEFENTPDDDIDVPQQELKTEAITTAIDETNKSEVVISTSVEPEAVVESSKEVDEADFDKCKIVGEVSKKLDSSFADDVITTSSSVSYDNIDNMPEDVPEEQVLSRLRRRKKRSKLSDDDEDLEDEDEFDEMSFEEEATEDVDDEESFDEAEEGHLPEEEEEDAEAEVASASVLEDERENGDGQESESNQESKTKSGGKVAKAKGEIEDKRNPQYIPRKGPFYEHDDRGGGETETKPTKETADSTKANADGEENAEGVGAGEKGVKTKKRQMATMKLRSDEMADDEAEAAADADQSSSKSASKEKLQQQKQDDSFSSSNADTPERGAGVPGVSVSSSPSTAKSSSVDSKGSSLQQETARRTKALWDSKDRWSHDKFNVDDQKPKSREELINSYGYDIRDETEAPKLQRRSKYGKGPQKYSGGAAAGPASSNASSRRSDDDSTGSSFAKRSLRKVIVRTSPRENKSDDNEQQHPESLNVREKVLRDEEDRMAISSNTFAGKKDQVFSSSRQSPKDRKVISKDANYSSSRLQSNNERPFSSQVKSSTSNNSYADREGSSRVHENRVFVNKSGGRENPSSGRFASASNKNNERPPAREARGGGQADNGYGYREDRMSKSGDYHNQQQNEYRNRDNEPEPHYNNSNEKSSKELFSNDDFPELVSAPSKGATGVSNLTLAPANVSSEHHSSSSNQPQQVKNNKIIYYNQNSSTSSAPSSKGHYKDTHPNQHHQQHSNMLDYSKEYDVDNVQSAGKQQQVSSSSSSNHRESVPVLKSQMFENSRYSRSRNAFGVNNDRDYDRPNWNRDNRDSNSNRDNNMVNNGRSLGPVKSSQYASSNQHPQHQQSQQQPLPLKKQQPLLSTGGSMNNRDKDESALGRDSDTYGDAGGGEVRPKRYSSIRQQQQTQRTVPSSTNMSSNNNHHQGPQQPHASVSPNHQQGHHHHQQSQQHQHTNQQQQQQKYNINLNSDNSSEGLISGGKGGNYYEPATGPSSTPVNAAVPELSVAQTPQVQQVQHQQVVTSANSMMGNNNNQSSTQAIHHPLPPHAYQLTPATMNGSPQVVPVTAGGAYLPATTPIMAGMAFYDPNTATAQAGPGGAGPAGPTGPTLGLTPAYHFTTDASGNTQPSAPNYYLTTADLASAVAAYHHPTAYQQLQAAAAAANYQQQISAAAAAAAAVAAASQQQQQAVHHSHQAHQSHVTSRYLNTTPANAAGVGVVSAEANRYLQTQPSTVPNASSILVSGGQAYSAQALQAAYPAGYPQFPPSQPVTSTPVPGPVGVAGSSSTAPPAGYPNLPMPNANSVSSGAASATAPASVGAGNSGQATPSGYPELYRGGITYYDIQSQQQAMQRHQHHHQNIVNQQPLGGPSGRRTGGKGSGHGDDGDQGDGQGVDKGSSSKHPSTKSEISVSN